MDEAGERLSFSIQSPDYTPDIAKGPDGWPTVIRVSLWAENSIGERRRVEVREYTYPQAAVE